MFTSICGTPPSTFFEESTILLSKKPEKEAVHWLTALTERALGIGMDHRLKELGKPQSNRLISQLPLPTKDHFYVKCDEGKILKARSGSLYTTAIGTSLAILIRARPKNVEQVTYTSLNHVFEKPKKFSQTLKNIIHKINKLGTLEIFISGGYAATSTCLKHVYQVIEENQSVYPKVTLQIQDETFKIADLGSLQLIYHKKAYSALCGLLCVGFNEQLEPYQVIDYATSSKLDHLPEAVIWGLKEIDPFFHSSKSKIDNTDG